MKIKKTHITLTSVLGAKYHQQVLMAECLQFVFKFCHGIVSLQWLGLSIWNENWFTSIKINFKCNSFSFIWSFVFAFESKRFQSIFQRHLPTWDDIQKMLPTNKSNIYYNFDLYTENAQCTVHIAILLPSWVLFNIAYGHKSQWTSCSNVIRYTGE